MSDYPIIRTRSIGKLTVLCRGYGMDYYWRGRYFLTSGHYYVIFHSERIDISFLLQRMNGQIVTGLKVNHRLMFGIKYVTFNPFNKQRNSIKI